MEINATTDWTLIRPIKMYDIETWFLKENFIQKLMIFERKY
jgi:hypothetical protein